MGLIEGLVIVGIILFLIIVVAGAAIIFFMVKRTVKLGVRLAVLGGLLFFLLLVGSVGVYFVYSWTCCSPPPQKSKPTKTR